MGPGQVMLDLEGVELSPQEYEMLRHPQAGGVILFTRNFESVEQIAALVDSIHSIREPHLLVAVDHEGGRVQRFRDGFTRLPSSAAIGEVYDQDKANGEKLAEQAGWIMASELRAVGIDFSFAPVLDINHGVSGVIGDRAFHRTPHGVIALGKAYVRGMRKAGMEAVGKHFPGHGGVREDSHLTLPEDGRPLDVLLKEDVLPFVDLANDTLAGIMPAHVRYTQVDELPAGFSSFWLQEILREKLRFQGAIFSDDLSMAGAESLGTYPDRARAALDAGCDMVLVCNHPEGAATILDTLPSEYDPVAGSRLARFHRHRRHPQMNQLRKQATWQAAFKALDALANKEQDLNV